MFSSASDLTDASKDAHAAPTGPAPVTKRERTRGMIRDIALRSFQQNGYDATTVRKIADEAGISVGSTHYHFPSKNHLVQELYLDVQQAHAAAATAELEGVRDLVDRIAIVFRTGLVQLEPYHQSAPEFLAASMSPRSPINPLSKESAPAFDILLGVFERAVEGSRSPLPAEFRAQLPQALVMAHMLLALQWVYDTSAEQERTQKLLDRALKLLRMTLPLTRLPMVKAPLRELFAIVDDVRP